MAKRKLPFADLSKRMEGRSILPLAPKNKRPSIAWIVEQFEKDGQLFSATGMSVNILAWYMIEKGDAFEIVCQPMRG